ncbi:MAG TPA: hypothetical protein VFZ19_12260 [Solirubrobacterales bacterium]
MRRVLVIPTALVGLLVLTPTVSATFGLLRPGAGPEAKEGGTDQAGSHPAALTTGPPSGGTEVPPPPSGTEASPPSMTGGVGAFWPQTDGIGVFPAGGISPGSAVETGKCRKGAHKVKRKGKVRCVKKSKGAKGNRAGDNRRAAR